MSTEQRDPATAMRAALHHDLPAARRAGDRVAADALRPVLGDGR